jgi:hypothetical protein
VGLKQKQPVEAIKVADNALFSLKAWSFLYNLRFTKKIPQQYLLILQEKSLSFTNYKSNFSQPLVS